MHSFFKSHSYNTLLIPLMVLLLSSSFLQAHLPLINRHWIVYGISAIVGLFAVKQIPNISGFGAYIVYSLASILFFIAGIELHQTFIDVGIELLIFIFPICSVYYILNNDDKPCITRVVVVYIIVLLSTLVCTYMADTIMPGIVRLTASGLDEIDNLNEYRNIVYSFGAETYAFAHALPIVIPGLVLLIKNSLGTFRLIFIACLISCLLLIILSGATTPLLLGIITLLFAIVTKDASLSKNIRGFLVLSVILGILYLGKSVIVYIFLSSADLLNDIESLHSISERLVELADFINYGETSGDMEARTNLYSTTWRGVITGFFVGGGEMSHHAALLDRLAAYGLIGFIPLVVLCKKQYSFISSHIDSNNNSYFIEGVVSAIIICSLKNVFSMEVFLNCFLILPVLILYAQQIKQPEK